LVTSEIISAYKLVCYKGLGFCAFRAQYELRKRSGLLKRKFPAKRWSEISLYDSVQPEVDCQPEDFLKVYQSNGRHFFFDGNNLPKVPKQNIEKTIFDAEQILQNKFRYFFDKSYWLGDGPDWFLNPATGKRAKSHLHWCDVDLFDPEVGDIKFIWELSRFAWAYTLVRAYAATGDNKYAEKFWQLFESWIDANQPNTGPNYACGQECAIRVMAMCFAYFALVESTASTEQKLESLVKVIIQHADRIENNISFAISTRTNHSITEAAGLYTVGLLFPQFKRSEHWLKYGKKILIREGLKQIYPDGSYIQHSMNYHRLMLQNYIWVLRLAELNNDVFLPELTDRVKKAVEFIYQLQDKFSGQVPNYGANDGAVIIPLNSCEYLDYRPIIQAGYYLFDKKKLFESGLWDEDLLWFFGPEALESKTVAVERKSLLAENGGYYTIRHKDGWAMMRCHTFKDRPAHADMLHLDLWWKGINVLRDSGSYLYNCPEKWQKYFMGTAAHNTVCIDSVGQMKKGRLWNWYCWTKSSFLGFTDNPAENIKTIAGEHYGYKRLGDDIIHKRTVCSIEDYWVIVDDITGKGKHLAELYWQLNNCSITQDENLFVLNCPAEKLYISLLSDKPIQSIELIKGEADIPAGFESLYYGQMQSAPVVKINVNDLLPVKFITLLSCGKEIKDLKFDKSNNQLIWTEAESSGVHKLKLQR
jgi:hypothetical protein